MQPKGKKLEFVIVFADGSQLKQVTDETNYCGDFLVQTMKDICENSVEH
jgi:hypothetical protein